MTRRTSEQYRDQLAPFIGLDINEVRQDILDLTGAPTIEEHETGTVRSTPLRSNVLIVEVDDDVIVGFGYSEW